jgi:hypothetical protein
MFIILERELQDREGIIEHLLHPSDCPEGNTYLKT